MKEAVVVVARRGNKFLGVSRRDDFDAFGLPGGKVDPGETAEEAARRELFEETGLEAGALTPFFQSQEGSFLVTSFVTDVRGQISPRDGETGVVAWVNKDTLCTGPLGQFNTDMFDALDEFESQQQITVADVAALMERHRVPSTLRAEFMRGLEVEWEHAETVGYDLDMISQIVCDHLDEDSRYYSKLRRMHRDNPREKRWPRPSEIQSLIFDRDMFTPAQARRWAVQHEFKATKVDLQPNTIRIRQMSPNRFDSRYGFRTIGITDGVQATVGVPLER